MTYFEYRQWRLADPTAAVPSAHESWPARFANEQAIGAVPNPNYAAPAKTEETPE